MDDFVINKGNLSHYYGDATEVYIPEEVTSIGCRAFSKLPNLEIIHFPVNVNSIKKWFVDSCPKLKRIIVDENNPIYSNDEHNLLSKDRTELIFHCQPNSEEYVVESYIEKLASYSFSNCKNPFSLFISSNVKYLEEDCLRGASLSELKIDSNAGSEYADDLTYLFTYWHVPPIPVRFFRKYDYKRIAIENYLINPQFYESQECKEYNLSIGILKYLLLGCDHTSDSLANLQGILDSVSIGELIESVDYNILEDYMKVFLLERVVIDGSIADLEKVWQKCAPFELTSRALGYASLYGGYDKVKFLVENKASFKYVCKQPYETSTVTNSSEYYANYSLCSSWNFEDAYISSRNMNASVIHFAQFYSDNELVLPVDERCRIIDYLIDHASDCNFDVKSAHAYSIIWDNRPVAESFNKKSMDTLQLLNVFNDDKDLRIKNDLFNDETLEYLRLFDVERYKYVLNYLIAFFAKQQQKIRITMAWFKDSNIIFLKEIMQIILEHADVDSLKKPQLVGDIISKEQVDTLAYVAESGWITSIKQCDKYIELAQNEEKLNSLSLLLEYRNSHYDLVKEEAKEEAKMMKEFMEDPNSVSTLKKKWSYVKLGDGTLQITNYKGDEEEIEIPSVIGKASVTSIGEEAFSVWKRSIKNKDSRKKIKSVIIPDGVTKIGDSAFGGCQAIEKIALPNSVKKIGDFAFKACSSLKDITLPDGVKTGKGIFNECASLCNEDGLIIIGDTLYGRYNLKTENTTLVIPSGVVRIAPEALSGGYSSRYLVEVVLPDGLIEIGEGVFHREYGSFEKINIPSSVKKIGKEAFKENYRLTSIELPEGLTSIGVSAFEGTGITELRIPTTIKSLPSKAFYGCDSLRDAYIPATVEKIGDALFGAKDGWFKAVGVHVHTPSGSMAEECMKKYAGIYVSNDYTE